MEELWKKAEKYGRVSLRKSSVSKDYSAGIERHCAGGTVNHNAWADTPKEALIEVILKAQEYEAAIKMQQKQTSYMDIVDKESE